MSEDEIFNNESNTDAVFGSENTEVDTYDDLNFEEALENFLPTPQNTDKVKKRLPDWLIAMLTSVATCIVILVLYTVFIVPQFRPTAVISYSGEKKMIRIRKLNPPAI